MLWPAWVILDGSSFRFPTGLWVLESLGICKEVELGVWVKKRLSDIEVRGFGRWRMWPSSKKLMWHLIPQPLGSSCVHRLSSGWILMWHDLTWVWHWFVSEDILKGRCTTWLKWVEAGMTALIDVIWIGNSTQQLSGHLGSHNNKLVDAFESMSINWFERTVLESWLFVPLTPETKRKIPNSRSII